jgi:hypothetical protein
MNRKGFIFTMDAVLALIPVFVVLGSLSTISYDGTQFSVVPLEREANDALQMLTLGECPLINQYLTGTCFVAGNKTPEEKIEDGLNGTLIHSYLMEYNLNQGGGWTFLKGRSGGNTSEADVSSVMDTAQDVFAAERIIYHNSSYSNVTLRMYVWVD